MYRNSVSITVTGDERYRRGVAFAYALYAVVHNVHVEVYPDVLAVACNTSGVIVGTMGLIYEHGAPHFFEQSEPPGAFERLAPNASRDALAEISRFAITPSLTPHTSRAVAQDLAAHLYAYGYRMGIRHFGFVGKTSFRSFLAPLGIEPIMLGKPTFEHVDRERMGTYASQKNLHCFGFTLISDHVLQQYITRSCNVRDTRDVLD